MKTFFLLLLVTVATSSNIGNTRQDVTLSTDGGYTNILVAIDDSLPDNPDIIRKLKLYFTEASKVLLNATNNRLYFKNFTIVVPDTWTYQSGWSEPTNEQTVKRARVVVADANVAYGNEPYTRQPGACGQEGDFIHFTPDYLKTPIESRKFKPAKRIVKEFAKLKWGLFDEKIPVSDTKTSRFYSENNDFKVQGCVENLSFLIKDQTKCTSNQIPPPPPCDFVLGKVDSSASLLAYEYLDSVTGFCTESKEGSTHNTLSKNLQNKNCKRSAWSVMSRLEDFATDFGKNRSSAKLPDPTFQIVQKRALTTSTLPVSRFPITTASLIGSATTSEVKPTSQAGFTSCPKDVVCICLDTSGSMISNDRITIMSEAVQLYIHTSLRNGTAVGIVSFNSEAFLNMDMTEINDEKIRSKLRESVPVAAGGGTTISAGIEMCIQILKRYTECNIRNTRIILHSDGEGHVGDSIKDLVREEVILDTVLFGQGGFLADEAEKTGGKQIYINDTREKQLRLDSFYEETASRNCDVKDTVVLHKNDAIIIPAGEQSHKGRVYFDVTTGFNVKMIFKYNGTVNISVSTNLSVSVSKDAKLRTTLVLIEGQLIVGYIGIFQGYSPVLQLNVSTILEDPTGKLTRIQYNDDGTGNDSVPNDGIYTGFLPSHLIGGDGANKYYGLTIDISGEGVLPSPPNEENRKKRCVSCKSVGNVTRTGSGGVIVIENWTRVPDTTPPQMITDLTTVEASADSGLILLSWTAPGDDLNIRKVSGYEFGIGADLFLDAMISLESEAILTNVSTFLVEAGTVLHMHVNSSAINLTVNGNSASDGRNGTFYFRIRTNDFNNNFARWSNPAPASFVDPETIAILLRPRTTTLHPVTTEAITQPVTTETLTTITEDATKRPIGAVKPPTVIIAVSVGAVVFLLVVVAVGLYACYVRSRKSYHVKRQSDHNKKEDISMSRKQSRPSEVQPREQKITRQSDHDKKEDIPMSRKQSRPSEALPREWQTTRNAGDHVSSNLEENYSPAHMGQQEQGSDDSEPYHKRRQPPAYDNPAYA